SAAATTSAALAAARRAAAVDGSSRASSSGEGARTSWRARRWGGRRFDLRQRLHRDLPLHALDLGGAQRRRVELYVLRAEPRSRADRLADDRADRVAERLLGAHERGESVPVTRLLGLQAREVVTDRTDVLAETRELALDPV